MEKATIKTTGSNGRYLYAVVPGSQERVYGCLGINGGNVYTIAAKDVAAVVSDVPHQKIRPERRHFAAHQAVLKRVMLDGDLLPMSFGIISQGPKAVRAILSRNNKSVQQQLKRISGKAEMGIKVTWDVPNIFEYFIDVNRELREARNKLVQPNYLPTQQEKIEIGRMFEEILNLERERHTKQVERVMSKRCSEIKRSKCRTEIEVMNLSCLVDRTLLSDFEAGVLEAASHFDDSFAFDFNGPWAPHNFVDLEIDV
ncbi:GvpL/GvpF family gas vesicle protein [Desulfomonile tiedjei]|uniref:Gas vesicle synthesis protein GvpL/GvpF n=1 Tax=Desulfomonile tiedjei (strain ATCC 49306 / DSM 6799 / DCB-1) TaxID=706587 RepID=I4CDC2_DESTA|nr:GvpL/GvpF family gas vesicle protein [Desulfomonile tiedjei]AFM27563.1 Gas vesicle synthesis protein GvpL/GvpF [Desulfomonile tiedjei DSM 6799]